MSQRKGEIAGAVLASMASIAVLVVVAKATQDMNVVPVSTLTVLTGFGVVVAAVAGFGMRIESKINAAMKDQKQDRAMIRYLDGETAEARHNIRPIYQVFEFPDNTYDDLKSLRWKPEPNKPERP